MPDEIKPLSDSHIDKAIAELESSIADGQQYIASSRLKVFFVNTRWRERALVTEQCELAIWEHMRATVQADRARAKELEDEVAHLKNCASFGCVMQKPPTEYLRRLCQACGEFDGARPDRPEAVYEKCISRVVALKAQNEHLRGLIQCL